MVIVSWQKWIKLSGTTGLVLHLTAWTFSAGYRVHILISISLVSICIAISWLCLSVSIGRIIVSNLVDLARAILRIPFRLIRATPRLIRLVFFEAPIILAFYAWFRALELFDRHALRRILSWVGGLRHASGVRISTVNALSPSFTPISRLHLPFANEFDLRTAISLSNLSKLAYEDEEVVRYELKRAGFDLERSTFIHYHNTYGFVTRCKDVVVISFRGTEPLNLMHVMTDLQGSLVDLSSLDKEADHVNAGKAHYGFLEALRIHRTDEPNEGNTTRESKAAVETIALEDEDSIGSAFTALFKIGGFLFRSFARQPIALKLPRKHGRITAFQQITEALDKIMRETPIRQIYCTGHSLGGALATVYFAQAQLSSMPESLVRKMVVYSFGAPRFGDARLKSWFSETGASQRVFKVVNAQDLIPRMPTLPEQLPKALRKLPYAESPGTLIHINPLARESSSLEETPGLFVHEDGCVPPIVFWGLSGLLSLQTVKKIRTEPWLWITARVCIPFMMFDHLVSQYAVELETIYRNSDDGQCENQVSMT